MFQEGWEVGNSVGGLNCPGLVGFEVLGAFVGDDVGSLVGVLDVGLAVGFVVGTLVGLLTG